MDRHLYRSLEFQGEIRAGDRYKSVNHYLIEMAFKVMELVEIL